MTQLAVIAALIGTPNVTFVADHWATVEPQNLVPADPPLHLRASDGSRADAIARAIPVARRTGATPSTPATLVAGSQSSGSWVTASWYGPGFFGNRTACGQTLTPSSWGVAHRTLPCGTVLQITYRGQTVSTPVIDRGPYVSGRELDLASAVAVALGFTGVQPVYVVVP